MSAVFVTSKGQVTTPKRVRQALGITTAFASLGKRYLWWKTPEEVAAHPGLLIARIMNIGAWDDVVAHEATRQYAADSLKRDLCD